MASSSLVYGASLVAHGALGLLLLRMPAPTHRESIAISVSEAKKRPSEPAKVVEAPPSPESPTEAARPRRAAPPKPAAQPAGGLPRAAATKAFDALPDLGIALGNDGPGGVAVPAGGGGSPAPLVANSAAPIPRVLAPNPAEGCTEAIVKPKLRSITQPAATTAAREAKVEGRVRVEATVGADGAVAGVRLLGGLGYGLDEASLEAARHASFDPATRCGKPVVASFVMALRFRTQ